jgi:hypothetical protein
MEEINTELLITLVEERSAIWDKTLDCYKNKKIKGICMEGNIRYIEGELRRIRTETETRIW